MFLVYWCYVPTESSFILSLVELGRKKRENLIRCLITRGALITDISSALHTTVVSRKIGYTFEVASYQKNWVNTLSHAPEDILTQI